jgi:hypothetical protein
MLLATLFSAFSCFGLVPYQSALLYLFHKAGCFPEVKCPFSFEGGKCCYQDVQAYFTGYNVLIFT